jgi:glycosyltransferase involved in cell wall biosynthesis
MIQVRDCNALIKASLRILQTPGLSESLGKSARELVVKQFSLQTMYEQTRQLYMELLK